MMPPNGTRVSLYLMVRFCENTYRFVGILCVLKQGVALGTKEVYAPMCQHAVDLWWKDQRKTHYDLMSTSLER